ncbi:MAG: C40 family peptidase [Thermoguttaceae bacterium]|nr:C40 family peptidase [Thermoguttaceae bacterium]
MKRATLLTTLTLLFLLVGAYVAAAQESDGASEKTAIAAKLDEIKAQFAPDKRLELFNVEFSENANPPKARLETTSAAARNAALELQKDFRNWKIEAALYPEENDELDGKWRAIVVYSTIQIQTAPDYGAEWSTQSLMGTPVRVLKKTPSYWILVQNADGYIGYTTRGSVRRMTQEEYDKWLDAPRLVWLRNVGDIFSEPDANSASISDLVANNVMVWKDQEERDGYYRVETPDGRLGWIEASGAMEWNEWLATRELTAENLIASARRMLGRPYVWGGTSAKGVDCSGLINFAFYTNGYNILRDVSQIQREGIEVDMSKGWRGYEPGDLLLFGAKRSNGAIGWRHVGLYIGDGLFIHSATSVHEASLDPDSPLYDEGNAKELQKVARMIGAPETEYFHPIGKNKAYAK